MEVAANSVPDDVNVKLIIRHSIRPSLKDSEDPDNVLLSSEGELLAQEFGINIQYSIGELHSSFVPRCIQTLNYILRGKNDTKNIIIKRDVLSDVFSYDRELSDQVFKKEGSMKKVVYLLNDGVFLPGFNTLESSARRMLDYIFNTGGVYRTLDIYCTHDFHIALLLTALWKNNVTLKSIEENWPNMLEGLFIWGERNDFYCSWRYMKGHFVNFMN